MILALVAALVGPYFVDWDGWRETFEAEASRAAGTPVTISGPIAVRLLPTPSLDLGSVALSAGGTRLSTRAMRVELALGPLMRGQWRVAELTLDAPQLDLTLDGAGRIGAPALPAGFDPDMLSVERLVVENGRAVLADASSGGNVTLDNVVFKGDLRSLAGPLRGEGAFVTGGTLYGVRLSAGRAGADGGVRLRLNVDPLDRPLLVETDGTLWLGGPTPRFDGALTLSRPAGTGLGPGRAVAHEPWRGTGRRDATASRAKLAQAELQYGPEDRAVRLTGSADLVLGRFPRLDLAVQGRHVDLDRAAAVAPSDQRSPPEALQGVLRNLVAGLRAPVPVKAALEIDSLVAGGTTLQNLKGTVASAADGVALDGVELRAPGLTQLRLSGALRTTGQGLAFAGPVSLESGDPRALSAWIEGRADAPKDAAKSLGPLRAKGDVVLDHDRVAVEALSFEIDRKAVEGRFAYAWPAAGRSAWLDAALKAGEIDLDSTVALVSGALAGAKAEWPAEATLALTVGKAVWGRLAADRVEARVGYGAGGVTIERLAIGDLRGATLEGAGRIDTSITAPQGSVTLALKAPRTDALVALLEEFAPEQARELRRYASALGSAELRAKLDVVPASPDPAGGRQRSAATLSVDGRLGTVRLAVAASGTGDPSMPAAAQVRIDGTLEGKESAALAALLGIDRVVALDGRPATVTLAGGGRLDGDIEAKLDVASGGLWITASGTGRREIDGLSGRADVSVTASDARLLASAGTGPLPVSLKSRVTLSGPDLRLDDLAGRIAGAGVKGHLALRLAEPRAVDGRIETTDLALPPVLAAVTGATRRPAGRDSGTSDFWPTEPFGRPGFADLFGRIEIEAARAVLLPGMVAQNLTAVVRLDGFSFAVEDAKARLADGALSVDAELRQVPTGLSARTRLALSGADIARLVPGSGKAPPAQGRLSISAELDGAGLSPAALVGALRGTGAVTVDDVQLSGLDPKAVDAGIRAVERGLPLERLAGYLVPVLETGRLSVPKTGGALSVVDGRVRLGPMDATVDGTDVSLSAGLDLGSDALDARFTLLGPGREDAPGGRRPEVGVTLRGPWAAPKRTVDTTALVTWVTLRSVEQEAKRVEAAEREAKRRDALAAAERARLEKERLERERVAREAAAREVAAREAAARATLEVERPAPSEPDPAATASTPAAGRPANAAPALPAPIEIKPQPVRPATGVTPGSPQSAQAGAGAQAQGQGTGGQQPAARPARPASAQAQPQPETRSPVRSLMQLFNIQ
ncbi:hypothetical protein CH341_19420 [Rhodoplanes roseus]|uniref:AsmA domain-containing protein n=2 Tax=Rhodoplanes roseus TaxID=29409 RepID=A0A327KWJ3_9BRAD|nr:hypothetical protein CH341_19420 [Rhodoplanes roseus]